jgi:hypothetical protein
MNGRTARFNSYLLAALIGVSAGCASDGAKTADSKSGKPAKSKTSRKEWSTISLHAQVNPDGTTFTIPAAVYRASPVKFHVQSSPFLNEGNIAQAEIIQNQILQPVRDAAGNIIGSEVAEDPSSFSIRLTLDRQGGLLLENITTAYRSSRILVHSSWADPNEPQGRWLAAVFVSSRITDGKFIFTPDATREEAERIVRGLNNIAAKLRTEPGQ